MTIINFPQKPEDKAILIALLYEDGKWTARITREFRDDVSIPCLDEVDGLEQVIDFLVEER